MSLRWGCIYSAQGFEFDRVGVIWGPDLVWRHNGWVAQREHSFDLPVKSKTANTQHLVRNAYQVLLTRGIMETRLLILDRRQRTTLKKRSGRQAMSQWNLEDGLEKALQFLTSNDKAQPETKKKEE